MHQSQEQHDSARNSGKIANSGSSLDGAVMPANNDARLELEAKRSALAQQIPSAWTGSLTTAAINHALDAASNYLVTDAIATLTPAQIVWVSEALASSAEKLSQHKDLAAKIVWHLAKLEPEPASIAVNALLSHPIPDFLLVTIQREWVEKSSFWSALRGLNVKVGHRLLDTYSAILDEKKNVDYSEILSWFRTEVMAHPEVFTPDVRFEMVRLFVDKTLQHNELSVLGNRETRIALSRYAPQALEGFEAARIAQYLVQGGFEGHSAVAAIPLFPTACHDEILRAALGSTDRDLNGIIKKLDGLSLAVLEAHIEGSLDHVPLLLKNLARFNPDQEALQRIARVLESKGQFEMVVNCIRILPDYALDALEPEYGIKSYRQQVGIADIKLYREYREMHKLENPITSVFPHWLKSVRTREALRSEKEIAGEIAEQVPVEPLYTVIFRALRARFAV